MVMGKTPMQQIGEYIRIIIAALFLAAIIRTFIVQPYYIPSGSMLNTLYEGDRVLVTKFSYGIHLPFMDKEIFSTGQPKIGDIIVFPSPENPSVDFIKRVVGLPGDVLEVRDKQFYRNGEAVTEEYVIHSDPNTILPVRDNMAPITVPEGKVFVMGDNRDASADSRYWKFVDKDTIRGKAQLIYWSSVNFKNIKWDRIGNAL